MNDTLLIILIILALFVPLLLLKQKFKWRFCVLCAAISITWIGLLLLYWTGLFNNSLFIGVLMGESAAGLFFLAKKKAPECLQIFALPFILTLTILILRALNAGRTLYAFLAVSILWIALGFAYAYRQNYKIKKLFDSLISCCKDW